MASYKEAPRDQKVSSDAPDGAAGTAWNSTPSERDRNYDRKQTTEQVTNDSDDEPSPTHSLRMVDHYLAGRSLPSPPVMLRGREVLLAIGVFFLFSVSVGLFVFMVQDYLDQKKKACTNGDNATCVPDTCLTEACVDKAAFMLQLMNNSAQPCDDFWNYACGGWLARSTIPESFESWGVGQDVEKRIKAIVRKLIEHPIARDSPGSSERKAKTLYRACMDVKAIDRAGKASLETIINDLGGWAVLDSWRVHDWDFQKVLEHLHFTYWTNVFFIVWVAPDDKVSSKNVLQFDQSGLGMPDKSYYTRDASDPVVRAYKTFMGSVAKLLGAGRKVDDFVRKTFAFEKSLAQLHMAAGSDIRSSPEAMYNNVTIDELQTIANGVNWLKLLRRLTLNVTSSTVVLITNRSYMGNISNLIEDTDKRVLNYYMIWRLVQNLVSHLSAPFREAEQAYEAAEKGTRSSIARWQYCLNAVNEWFGMTVGAMFVREHFPRDNRADVDQMIKNIQETFLDTLNKNPWMDSATKENATEKLKAMGYKIGYPPFITNMTKVDVLYRWFSVDANDKYFDINLKCIKGTLRKMANELRRSEGKTEWEMNPHEVNAYYTPVTNQMVFPAGILQKPYYTKNVPIYINYGGIGATIGHELTHGFDNYGAQYDKNGNLNNWWTNTSWTNFKNRTRCMADYYSQYRVNNISVNGQLTLGENIADVGGVIQAYEAYKKAETRGATQLRMPALGLSNDQAFFLSFGQSWCTKRRPENMKQYLVRNVHSPAAVRARGTLSLVPQFAKAFRCPPASPMNPANGCKVW